MIRRLSPSTALVAAALMLAGCAVGPDYASPERPPVERFTPEPLKSAAGQTFVTGAEIAPQWWEVFHSKQLDDLVVDAIAHSPNLQAMETAISVARYNAEAQKGAFFPQVAGLLNPSRNLNYTYNTIGPTANASSPYTLYLGQLSVSYVVDIWGGNRRAVESLEALTDVQKYQYQAAYLTLATNVVTAAILEASFRGQIAATQRIIRIETDVLGIIKKQYALGQISEADVLAQEAALAQVKQMLPPLEKQLALQRDLLTALSGRFSSDQIAQRFELSSFKLPRTLPVSLPASFVEQRPDIKQAESNVHSASALVGVAVANRLPNVTLNAAGGTAAATLGTLFAPGSLYYTLAASVAQTIFDGGTLANKQRVAEATLIEAQAQYRNTVITAFQNVIDALRALQSDGKLVIAAREADRAAAASLAIVQKQLQLGAINQLTVLNAQQTSLQAGISLVQAEATRLADTAALFMALGGGWTAPPDTAEARVLIPPPL